MKIIRNREKPKYRHEYKCRINRLDVFELRNRLKSVMGYDNHADENGIYCIKSLYFDNYFNKALNEKISGVNRREKFRIRYYNNDISYMRLEKKSKINGLCNKQSSIISADDCKLILDGEIKSVFDVNDDLQKEFYAKMRYQLLRPKNIVAYEREAFTYAPGNVRVTFDSNIRGSNNVRDFLEKDNIFFRPDDVVILEIKWDEYIPQFIKDILQMGSRSISSFSKYAATRFI